MNRGNIMAEQWRVESTPTRVEGWCAERLKFEHRPEWMNRFRAELRNRLSALNGSEGLLHGVYSSSLPGFADAENVLFYNVGEGTFKHLAQKGMRFERSFQSAGDAYPHHHSYELTESPRFAHWEPAQELVSFADVPLPTRPKPKHAWLALQRAATVQLRAALPPGQAFGLSLKLITPEPVNLAAWIKPMFDGVICAFHRYEGPDIHEALAREIDVSPQETRALLASDRLNVLGSRRLIYPRGSGVQWNPADDFCHAGELIRIGEGPWAMSGSLFSIREILEDDVVTLIHMIEATARKLNAETLAVTPSELHQAFLTDYPDATVGADHSGFTAELGYHCVNMRSRVNPQAPDPHIRWTKRPLFYRVSRGKYKLLTAEQSARLRQLIDARDARVFQDEYDLESVLGASAQ
jgi:hypothetical protein